MPEPTVFRAVRKTAKSFSIDLSESQRDVVADIFGVRIGDPDFLKVCRNAIDAIAMRYTYELATELKPRAILDEVNKILRTIDRLVANIQSGHRPSRIQESIDRLHHRMASDIEYLLPTWRLTYVLTVAKHRLSPYCSNPVTASALIAIHHTKDCPERPDDAADMLDFLLPGESSHRRTSVTTVVIPVDTGTCDCPRESIEPEVLPLPPLIDVLAKIKADLTAMRIQYAALVHPEPVADVVSKQQGNDHNSRAHLRRFDVAPPDWLSTRYADMANHPGRDGKPARGATSKWAKSGAQNMMMSCFIYHVGAPGSPANVKAWNKYRKLADDIWSTYALQKPGEK